MTYSNVHWNCVDEALGVRGLPTSIPVYVDGKEYLASVRELAASRVRLTWFEMDGTKQSVVRERAAVEWADGMKMAVAV